MGWVAVREGHHIWTTSHVNLVCPSPEVVRGVIDSHRVPLLKAVAMDINFVALGVREAGRFGVILLVEDSSEEVIRQLWNEVLMSKLAR